MDNKEKLYDFLETSERALIVGNVKKNKLFFCNQQAREVYGVSEDTAEFMAMFQEENRVLRKIMIKQMKKKESSFFYNIMTRKSDGTLQLADLQVGYLDREESEMFMEITPKEDNRMEIAHIQVDQSNRAEAILNFDENFSLIYCNDHFCSVFETNDKNVFELYGTNFSNGFQPDIREHLLAEIRENLLHSTSFLTKLKVITSKGKKKWYSLELQKRTLDNSGIEKIMAYLVNIESQVEIEEENKYINQQFDVIQELSDDLLFRVDLESKSLIRGSKKVSRYGLEKVVTDFPGTFYANGVIHQDDIPIFDRFAELSLQGKGGSIEIRMKEIDSDEFQYRKMIWLPIIKENGEIKEVYGRLVNIHNVKEMESELENVNHYFDAIQELSDDLMFRIDIKEKVLIRRTDRSEEFGKEEQVRNFPESIVESGLIHPDDLNFYYDFGERALAGLGGMTEVRMKSFFNEAYQYRRLTWTPVKSEDGSVNEVFGKLVNIHSMKELEEKANYDSLTNTLNKRAMLESTSEILNQSNQNDKHALFFMDLDNFKYVNDNLGHAFGDYLLSELGKRLGDSVRSRDLVGRVGGDEFVIFLRDVPSTKVLLGKAKLLLSTISEDFSDGTTHHNIHGSLGIAVYPDHGRTYEELYHHADLALYYSKNQGKNMVTLYNDDKMENI